MNNPRVRNIFVYVSIFVAIIAILWSVRNNTQQTDQMTLSEVAQAIKEGKVSEISVSGDDITVTFVDKNQKDAIARKEPSSTAPEQLAALGISPNDIGKVKWEVSRPSEWANLIPLLGYTLPALFVMGLIYFMLR